MATPIGHVTIVHGVATASAEGSVRPLEVGSPVFQDDRVMTQADSAVEIRFADDTVLAQGANSELFLDEYTYTPSTGNGALSFDMVQGTFRSVTGAIVDNNPENFELGSPLATIGIRGTVTAHTIPPSWAADNTEDHVVLVYDGKPVLVMSTEEGNIRLIDTSGRKVEVSEIGAAQVTVMTVAEYLYYEQLATQELDAREPVYDNPEDIIQHDPATDRPVGDNPQENLGDQNQGDENDGDDNPADMDQDGDTDQDDAQAAADAVQDEAEENQEEAEEIVQTLESLVLDGNGSDLILEETQLVIEDDSLQAQGSSNALQVLNNLISQGNTSVQNSNLITTTTTTTTTTSLPTVSFDTGSTTTLSESQVSSGFTATAPSANNVTVAVAVSGATPPPSGSSVTADFSSFNTTQTVQFDASAVTSGGYFTVTGGCCSDTVRGTNHNVDGDTINGGDGDDTLYGYYGDDTINGGNGADTIYGNQDSAPVGSGSDNDTINGGEGDDTIHGNEGNDTINGDAGNDDIWGDAGDDTINGGDGNDEIWGGDDNDTITGGAGADSLNGYDGADTFVFTGTSDVDINEIINGGTGTDAIRVDGNTDFSGWDVGSKVSYVEEFKITAGVTATIDSTQISAMDPLTIYGANNALSTVETLVMNMTAAGTADLSNMGPFTNWGSEDRVTLNGTTGNDTFSFNTNYNDTFAPNGGSGDDTLSFKSVSGSPTYTLANMTGMETVALGNENTTITTSGTINGGQDLIIDGSALIGTNTLTLNTSSHSGNVTVKSAMANNSITTGSGDDTIDFGSSNYNGNDAVNAGAGSDTVIVGAYGSSLNSLSNVETVDINDTSNQLTWTVADTVASSALTIDYTGVTQTSYTNTLDASAFTKNLTVNCATDSQNTVTLGSGNDTVTGSNETDTFVFGTRYTDADTVNGGGDTADKMTFTSDGTTTYSLANISYVEIIEPGAAATNITLTGDLLATGGIEPVWINGANMGFSVLTVDSSANSQAFKATGAAGGDTFTVGSAQTTIEGADGADTFVAASGTLHTDTTFNGGNGVDTVLAKNGANFTNQTNFATNFTAERLEIQAGGTATFNVNQLNGLNNFTTIFGTEGFNETIAFTVSNGGDDFSSLNLNFGAGQWEAGDTVRYNGTSDADTIVGSSHGLNETFYGGDSGDTITTGGGNDKVYGQGGNDTINMEMNLTASDVVDGGAGTDTLNFKASQDDTQTMAGVTNVENVVLGITLMASINFAGSLSSDTGTLSWDASNVSDSMTLNASNETTAMNVKASGGDDTITTGSGDDTIDFLTQAFGSSDSVNGGAGNDTLKLTGAGNPLSVANAVQNIETVDVDDSTNNINWFVDSSNVGAAMTIDLSGLTATGGTNSLNAGNVTQNLTIIAPGGPSNNITTGSGDDTMQGGNGADTFFFGTNFNTSDSVNGGAEFDILSFTSDGTSTYTFSNVSNVERFSFGNANTTVTLGGDVSLSTGTTTAEFVAVDLTTSVLTMDVRASDTAVKITGGSMSDTVTTDGVVTTFLGQDGDDTLVVVGATVDILTQFTGGSGTDVLKMQGTSDFTGANMTLFDMEVLHFDTGGTGRFSMSSLSELSGKVIKGSGTSATETLQFEASGTSIDFTSFTATFDASWGSEDELVITGTTGNDTFTGSDSNIAEIMRGGTGNDNFTPKGGHDKLYGEAGMDEFIFGAFFSDNNVVDGGDDTDTLSFTSNGVDTYTFTNVTNVENFILGNAATTINLAGTLGASDPTPTFDASAMSTALVLDASNETTGITVKASSGTNQITGSSGDDVFEFQATSFGSGDTLDGGAGTDELKINSATQAALNATRNLETYTFRYASDWTVDNLVVNAGSTVTFDFSQENGTECSYFDASAETDGHVNVVGTSNSDTIKGGSGNDTLNGGGSSDSLYGNSGNDTIIGGTGGDIIYSGTGNDIIKYTSTADRWDSLKDFETGVDKLQFVSSSFSNSATLVSGNFGGSYSYTPTTADAYFVYDQDSGKLWYDPDGNGATATEQRMATLHDGTNVLALDLDDGDGSVDIEFV